MKAEDQIDKRAPEARLMSTTPRETLAVVSAPDEPIWSGWSLDAADMALDGRGNLIIDGYDKRELSLINDGFAYFVGDDTTAIDGVSMFRVGNDGVLTLASDNVFACNDLLAAIDEMAAGRVSPEFISEGVAETVEFTRSELACGIDGRIDAAQEVVSAPMDGPMIAEMER